MSRKIEDKAWVAVARAVTNIIPMAMIRKVLSPVSLSMRSDSRARSIGLDECGVGMSEIAKQVDKLVLTTVLHEPPRPKSLPAKRLWRRRLVQPLLVRRGERIISARA